MLQLNLHLAKLKQLPRRKSFSNKMELLSIRQKEMLFEAKLF